MDKIKALQSVNEIKELMERSSKFVSLSGLTGILVGSYSLVGAYIANQILISTNPHVKETIPILGMDISIQVKQMILLALCILTASIVSAILISYYKAKKRGQKVFNKLVYRIIWSFAVPLITGGLFCIALLHHHHYGLTSSVMLLFYGLALINVSKYTFSNAAYLGYCFLTLGIIDCFMEKHAILFWAIGFGIFHILYGILFYLQYERKKELND